MREAARSCTCRTRTWKRACSVNLVVCGVTTSSWMRLRMNLDIVYKTWIPRRTRVHESLVSGRKRGRKWLHPNGSRNFHRSPVDSLPSPYFRSDTRPCHPPFENHQVSTRLPRISFQIRSTSVIILTPLLCRWLCRVNLFPRHVNCTLPRITRYSTYTWSKCALGRSRSTSLVSRGVLSSSLIDTDSYSEIVQWCEVWTVFLLFVKWTVIVRDKDWRLSRKISKNRLESFFYGHISFTEVALVHFFENFKYIDVEHRFDFRCISKVKESNPGKRSKTEFTRGKRRRVYSSCSSYEELNRSWF